MSEGTQEAPLPPPPEPERPPMKVEIKGPIDELDMNPLLEAFMARLGLRDPAQAAIRLAKYIKERMTPMPVDEIAKTSEFLAKSLAVVNQMPETETTKPIKEAVATKLGVDAAQQLSSALMKPGGNSEEQVPPWVRQMMQEALYLRLILESVMPQGAHVQNQSQGQDDVVSKVLMPLVLKLIDKVGGQPSGASEKPSEILTSVVSALKDIQSVVKPPQATAEPGLKETLEKLSKSIEENMKNPKDVLKEFKEQADALGIPLGTQQAEIEKLRLDVDKWYKEALLDLAKWRAEREDKREDKKQVLDLLKTHLPSVDDLLSGRYNILKPGGTPRVSSMSLAIKCPVCGKEHVWEGKPITCSCGNVLSLEPAK